MGFQCWTVGLCSVLSEHPNNYEALELKREISRRNEEKLSAEHMVRKTFLLDEQHSTENKKE